MQNSTLHLEVSEQGFACLPPFYSSIQVDQILNCIETAFRSINSLDKPEQVFAIRRFLQEVPGINELVFTPELLSFIHKNFGPDYFITKSIYFDKPVSSNWFVAYHQDLSISVTAKTEVSGFHNWTVKQGYFNVQPPVAILENSYTIRIHLDDTDEHNGALKVVPGSHNQGVLRTNNLLLTNEQICDVKKGGLMIMKPLLFHSSQRSNNPYRRRVIHIELCNQQLPEPLQWHEMQKL